MRIVKNGSTFLNKAATWGLALACVHVVGCSWLRAEYCPAELPPSPPVVVCTSPDRDVSGVSVDRSITVTFSEPMAYSTLTGANFTLRRGGAVVPGKVELTGGNAATFKPDRELNQGEVYTATVAAGIKDSAGASLEKTYEWSFSTVPAPVALVVLEDNHFEFDKSEITAKGQEILEDNIQVLMANPGVRIRIAGYTSARGTDDYNQKLSERRADAVKAFLVKGGIAADRLVAIGYGRKRPAEFEPIPENIYSKEAKANMRVLFDVIVK